MEEKTDNWPMTMTRFERGANVTPKWGGWGDGCRRALRTRENDAARCSGLGVTAIARLMGDSKKGDRIRL